MITTNQFRDFLFDALPQIQHLFFNQTNGFRECFIVLAAGIFRSPVFQMRARRELWTQKRAALANTRIVLPGTGANYSFSFALILQIICVMVPMGQKLHQVLGLNRIFTKRPMMVDVSMML